MTDVRAIVCGGPPEPCSQVEIDPYAIKKCPKCGGEIELGYGLAYGGIGTYVACFAEGCDWFFKRQDEADD